MVLPLAIVYPVAAAVGSSLVTAIGYYFYSSKTSTADPVVHSQGQINNTVELSMKENNNQNNTLVLMVGVLVFIRLIEVSIYAIKSYKRSLKRRYEYPAMLQRSAAIPTISGQQQQTV